MARAEGVMHVIVRASERDYNFVSSAKRQKRDNSRKRKTARVDSAYHATKGKKGKNLDTVSRAKRTKGVVSIK
jgi:hypothetical protein